MTWRFSETAKWIALLFSAKTETWHIQLENTHIRAFLCASDLEQIRKPSIHSPWSGVRYYGNIMKSNANNYELQKDDLLGHSPDDIACVQCGGVFCGLRVGRIYEGRPLILCSRKDAVKEILAAKPRRSEQSADVTGKTA